MTPPLTLILTGATLGEIIERMRFLLDTVSTDEGRALLAAMHADLPPAVRRAPKDKQKGAAPTREEAEAAFNAQAPACSADDVRDAMRAYLARFGGDAARHVPALLGAARVSDIPPENLWRAKSALEAAVSAGNMHGITPRKEP